MLLCLEKSQQCRYVFNCMRAVLNATRTAALALLPGLRQLAGLQWSLSRVPGEYACG